MVDLSVVGLLVAVHHLVLTGTEPDQLRSATRLMHLCGALTLALNTAEPVIAGHYGRACLDTVAPALLLGWGAVGPDLLRHLATPTPHPSKELAPDTIDPLAPPTPPTDQPTPAPEPTAPAADTATQAPPTPAAEPRRSPNLPRTPSPSPLRRPPRPLSPRPPRPRSCRTYRPRSSEPPAASPTTTALALAT